MSGQARAPVADASAFARSEEQLGPAQVELQRSWFTNWGLTPPGPAPDTSAASASKKAPAAKGKGKGVASKGGGFGTAAPAAETPLFCAHPPAGLVTVVRADPRALEAASKATSAEELTAELRALGEAARRTMEELLPTTGALLFRGLPMRSPEGFSHFWKGCLAAAPALEEGTYSSLGPSAGRAKLSGIDLATNVPPEFLLLCHNELCYNPRTVGRIALYCIQEAAGGGETVVARNADLGRTLPPSVGEWVREHGGLVYSRTFFDANHQQVLTSGAQGSWQDKCALPKDAPREAAVSHFKAMGFVDAQLAWDDDGGLTVSNAHPGYRVDEASGEEVWWNIAHTGSIKAADGTPFPKRLVADIQRTGWKHTYAFKLLPGDWLVLDNLRVQHGRLPYTQDPNRPRVLLTVYSTPLPA
jgi:hypothetical protein